MVKVENCKKCGIPSLTRSSDGYCQTCCSIMADDHQRDLISQLTEVSFSWIGTISKMAGKRMINVPIVLRGVIPYDKKWRVEITEVQE
jgi:hypothetical protein